MARNSNPEKIPGRITIQPTPEDFAILKAGMKKHGVIEYGQIIRMALRAWADREKLEVQAS